MALPRQTLSVLHLGEIEVGYRSFSAPLDLFKLTLILFNLFTTTADYYLPEFENNAIIESLNLVAIEPLGHGQTRLKKGEMFTYWDSAIITCLGLVSLAGNLDPADDFEPGNGYYDFLIDIGYGKSVDKETKDFWARTIKGCYHGNEGKRRICMAAVNLASRDSLHERLLYVNVKNAEHKIRLFTNSVSTKVVTFRGGVHFLSYTHKENVYKHLLEFIHN
ncbi:hypothetical protein B0O99DRAFT_657213 [Bisporella sp. PMI_857]|nr:hypothetical protein B0O99DRAFT_657213 [Bisporella sp. PMI_857]